MLLLTLLVMLRIELTRLFQKFSIFLEKVYGIGFYFQDAHSSIDNPQCCSTYAVAVTGRGGVILLPVLSRLTIEIHQ